MYGNNCTTHFFLYSRHWMPMKKKNCLTHCSKECLWHCFEISWEKPCKKCAFIQFEKHVSVFIKRLASFLLLVKMTPLKRAVKVFHRLNSSNFQFIISTTIKLMSQLIISIAKFAVENYKFTVENVVWYLKFYRRNGWAFSFLKVKIGDHLNKFCYEHTFSFEALQPKQTYFDEQKFLSIENWYDNKVEWKALPFLAELPTISNDDDNWKNFTRTTFKNHKQNSKWMLY